MNNRISSAQDALVDKIRNAKSQSAKIIGALSLLTLLQVSDADVFAQSTSGRVVNNKEYTTILQSAIVMQEPIGEDVAKFLFGGGLERSIQVEIEKQNNKHPDTNSGGKHSVFKSPDLAATHATDPIKSKEAIQSELRNYLDSLVQRDAMVLYKSFHQYQKGGSNVVGHKKGKGELGHGYNLAAFPVQTNVDFLADKSLPYSKDALAKLKLDFESIYNQHFSAWKTKALKLRSENKVSSYESADLLALEAERVALVINLDKTYLQPASDRVFTQYYSTAKDATNSTGKKK